MQFVSQIRIVRKAHSFYLWNACDSRIFSIHSKYHFVQAFDKVSLSLDRRYQPSISDIQPFSIDSLYCSIYILWLNQSFFILFFASFLHRLFALPSEFLLFRLGRGSTSPSIDFLWPMQSITLWSYRCRILLAGRRRRNPWTPFSPLLCEMFLVCMYFGNFHMLESNCLYFICCGCRLQIVWNQRASF